MHQVAKLAGQPHVGGIASDAAANADVAVSVKGFEQAPHDRQVGVAGEIVGDSE